MINTPSLNEARKQIQKIKKEDPKGKIIVIAQSEEFNRKILENKDVNVLLSPELHERGDRLKQRDSGLNEVLCKIAAKNKIKIGIDTDKIREKKGKELAVVLARIIQNIILCKKAGTDLIMLGKHDKKDAFSFLITLGASTSQAKKAIAA